MFDFDGVLANTEPLHLHAFQLALGRHGVVLTPPDYYERYLGYDDAGVFAALGRDRKLGWTDDDVAALVSAKAVLLRDVIASRPVLFDGVRDAVHGLAREVPLAIASGALREEIELILSASGLLPSFPVIVAAGETAAGKPEPDPYLAAVERLGVDASASVAVEDSVWGIESARRAGLKVVAVTTSYPRERLRDADLVVGAVSELTMGRLAELARREPPAATPRSVASSRSPRRDTRTR